MIKPEIGKLSRSLVDRIPLVMYIPAPPPGSPHENLTPLDPAHTYPPKPIALPTKPVAPKPRFKFIRGLSSLPGKKKGTPSESDDEKKTKEPKTWEGHWEQGEYPFVVLEGNRAACAICLMDFEEPKRIAAVTSESGATDLPEERNITEAPREQSEGSTAGPAVTEESSQTPDAGDDILRLANAGEGAQPLRLLACGHVFHVSP